MSEEAVSSTTKVVRTAAVSGAVLSLGAALVGPVAPAGAAPFTVLNNADSGDGSLRDAIDDANTAGGADTITFAPGLGTIELDSEITITDAVTITGPATISGGDSNRIFYIDAADSVTLSGLTLQDGFASGDGGAVAAFDTDLTIQQSSITGSTADEGDGGGLFVDEAEQIDITGSTFSDNVAEYNGGGAFFTGEEGTGTDIVVSGSTFDNNDAGDYGGGLGINHIYGTATIDTTTISRNTAGENGGGVYVHSHGDVAVTITSSTISGNTTDTGGGGLLVSQAESLDISHSTIAGNDAYYGGGLFSSGTPTTLDHVILGNNTANTPTDADVGISTGEGSDPPIETRFSLIESPPAEDVIDDVEGNIIGEDPGLAALADNGGPNETHALLASSPALDGGDPAFSPPPATDQRGLPRVQGEAIDLGAFETQPEDPEPPAPPAAEPPAAEPPAARPATAAPSFTG